MLEMRLTGVLRNSVLEEFQGFFLRAEIFVTEFKAGSGGDTLYVAS